MAFELRARRADAGQVRHKALTIINEHLLGVRLRAMGCRLIDVTWLAAVLRRSARADIDWNTGWRQQLAQRDQAAIVVPEPQ